MPVLSDRLLAVRLTRMLKRVHSTTSTAIRPATGRRAIAALLAGAAPLVLLLAALAIAGTWPFGSASGEVENGGHSVVWKGEAALLSGNLYGLDELPLRAEPECPHCVSVVSDPRGRPTLSAGNGILGWPQEGSPTYQGCIELRNHMTLDSVVLGAARTNLSAVALHGWMCATGSDNDGLMRLRYDGRRDGRFLFAVTSWGRPAEG